MTRHQEFKISNTYWLPEIPKHWNLERSKYLFNERIVKGFEDEPLLACTQSQGVILKSEYGIRTVEAMKDLYNLKLVKHKDFVISLRSFQGGIEYSYAQGIISPAYTILKLKKGADGFYKHLFKSKEFIRLLQTLVTGIREGQNIDNKLFKNSLLPVPPNEEQEKIAEFLDYKCKQIDSFIADKKRLIELLNEKKQAVINQAVTKGINPDAPMKPSGIDWLGDIPEHWEVRKISNSFKQIGSGTTPLSGDRTYYKNGTINWVNTGDLNNGYLDRTSKKITEKALEDYTTLKIYPINSLIIAMYGATIGKVSILAIKATTNQACCVLNKSKVLNQEFVFYWFQAQKDNIISLAYGGGQPNISQDLIRNIKISTPPIEEQQQIVSYVENETSEIDEAKQLIEQEIKLIEEYKQSLISEAVTGKVDLREWVKPKPKK